MSHDMPRLLEAARPVLLALNRLDVRYALCGGLAVAAHGHLRATRDIDILVSSAADVERIDAVLPDLGWIPGSDSIEFEDGFLLHRRIRPVGETALMLDILVPPDGADFLHDRELSELDGAACWVVGRESLMKMKRLANRPQDLADIDNLGGDA